MVATDPSRRLHPPSLLVEGVFTSWHTIATPHFSLSSAYWNDRRPRCGEEHQLWRQMDRAWIQARLLTRRGPLDKWQQRSKVWKKLQGPCRHPISSERDTRHTEGRPCEDTEKTVVSEPRREASEETKPADVLILDFQPPDLRDHNFLWFKWPSLLLCYSSLSEQIHSYRIYI